MIKSTLMEARKTNRRKRPKRHIRLLASILPKKSLAWKKSRSGFTKHFPSCPSAPVKLPIGYFANVLQITPDIGIAISTDGVGTKILVAEQLERFDTIGIDCVAMNVNDVLCVGARPISLVDYIAVQKLSPTFLQEIGIV